MKKFFFFASLLIAGTMMAQTVVLDGDNSEWAEVPMVTEPGGSEILKYLVPQDGVNVGADNAFAVMLQTTQTINGNDPTTIYVDADKSAATGIQGPWFLLGMYRDYEFGINDNGDGITGAKRVTKGNIIEITMPKSGFENVPFTGSFWAQFSYNWGKFYVPNSPEPAGDNWKWDQKFYNPTDVRPFSYSRMPGKHAFADTWSRHQCVAPGEVMDVNVSGGSQDTAFWCAWTVQIYAGVKYVVSADIEADNNASVDLYLVDVPTNKVVATFTSSDYWQPSGETALGDWDLSAVPAGKYLLKLKNHVPWSHMKLKSVTLTGDEPYSAIDDVKNTTSSRKIVRDGQVLIQRDGVYYNLLGSQVK